MPIATRYVEPRSVCADPLLTEEATRAGDALQAVAVRSMAGLIRQLGSLARHAESVMGELAESLASCHARTLDLEKRTRSLTVQVLPSLDPDREVLEGFEIPHPDLQFKSDKTIDQRLLSQTKHVSPALLEQYSQATPPPDLGQFSIDWEDGRNAMHFYSKPDFFFENWRDKIQRQTMRKMSQMDMLSPKHEGGEGGKKKRRQFLEGSTGSDKVSSLVQPVKRTFSLSRKPHPHKSIYGSTQSLSADPGYQTMPSYAGGRQGLPRRSSPSFHSTHSNHQNRRSHHHNQVVLRSQSMRHRGKKRPKLYSLASTTASLYVEQDLDIVPLPDTSLEASTRYEYGNARPQKKSSSIRRSQSFQKNKSKSPVPGVSTSSVLDTLHMYTVAEELAKLESSPFGLLTKHHLEHLDLGSVAFDTCLAIEPPKKENTTFRTPIGMRQRPVSSLDLHLVAMRNDGTGASRSLNLRLKHLSTTDVPAASSSSNEDRNSFPCVSNGPLFGIGGIVLRRRISMTGPNSQPRPVSASFVDPPTIKKMVAASRMSLQPHGGSLNDITRPDSPAQGDESPTTPKTRPKRPAPQAPGVPRPPSRMGTPDSGWSTPKGFRTQSPLVGYQSSLPNISPSPPWSSRETFTNTMTHNGRVTPIGPSIINNHLTPGAAFEQHRTTVSSPPKMLALQQNVSSPQLPSPPQLLPVIHRNTSSPQLPMIPIQEEDTPIIHHPWAPPEILTPSSPPVIMNGHVPTPPPFLRRDSLYISPRKQSLTLPTADKKRLRVSQILETGGIRGGDLSSSRLDLLEAIRKGIQLKQVEMKEREKENLVSMPWDVAAILERRRALELESDTSEEEDSNDTEWEDEN